MMIKEALQFLTNIGVEAATPKTLKPPAEPDHVYYIGATRMEADPEPRDHGAADLSAIVTFANAYKTATVWYSRSGVIAHIDDSNRRDRVAMSLQLSEQIEELAHWARSATPHRQAALILLLRTTFKDCIPESFLTALRQLRFATSSKTESKVNLGKTSIGKSIEAEVTGKDALPEEVLFNVPVFHGYGNDRAIVRVILDLDAATETITLYPVMADIDRDVREAEQAIGNQLGNQVTSPESRVFYGTP